MQLDGTISLPRCKWVVPSITDSYIGVDEIFVPRAQ